MSSLASALTYPAAVEPVFLPTRGTFKNTTQSEGGVSNSTVAYKIILQSN